MSSDSVIYEPDFYTEQISHDVPVLHYHLSRYTQLIGGEWDEDDYEVMEQRIDGRKSPAYPGASVIDQIRAGDLDPLDQGLLPYIRGWEWTLWLIPKPWFGRLPKKYGLIAVDGRRVTRESLGDVILRAVFGMAPLGVLVGPGAERFSNARRYHDEIIDAFQAAESGDECTKLVYEKCFAGEWYFPDIMVLIDDMFTHVDRHRALLEEDDE